MDDDDGFGDDAGEGEGMDEDNMEEPQSVDWGDMEAESGSGVRKSLGGRGAVRISL